LANSEYTIFVVERRWGDSPSGQTLRDQFVLGTTAPLDLETELNPYCLSDAGNVPHNEALIFGYYFQYGSPLFVLDQACNAVAMLAPRAAPPPAPLTEHTGWFSGTKGHFLSGGMPNNPPDTTPLAYAQGGAIGRAVVQLTLSGVDTRFNGDIAEVIIYDAALSDSDRLGVEAYLKAKWGY
jgi:hypothetical protein